MEPILEIQNISKNFFLHEQGRKDKELQRDLFFSEQGRVHRYRRRIGSGEIHGSALYLPDLSGVGGNGGLRFPVFRENRSDHRFGKRDNSASQGGDRLCIAVSVRTAADGSETACGQRRSRCRIFVRRIGKESGRNAPVF